MNEADDFIHVLEEEGSVLMETGQLTLTKPVKEKSQTEEAMQEFKSQTEEAVKEKSQTEEAVKEKSQTEEAMQEFKSRTEEAVKEKSQTEEAMQKFKSQMEDNSPISGVFTKTIKEEIEQMEANLSLLKRQLAFLEKSMVLNDEYFSSATFSSLWNSIDFFGMFDSMSTYLTVKFASMLG